MHPAMAELRLAVMHVIEEVDTALARVVYTSPVLVEAHIKPDVRITAVALQEIMRTRRAMVGDTRGALYVIAPGELDWELAALQTDYFGPEGENLSAVAVMVDSKVLSMVVNSYFSLFPSRFPTKVFDNVEDGRVWLASL